MMLWRNINYEIIWRVASMGSITIKGNKDGIAVYVNSNNYEDVKKDLMLKIQNARDFFSGCKMKIIDNHNNITHENYEELSGLLHSDFGINVFIPQKDEQPERKQSVFYGINEGRTKFLKNTVRSGQRLYYNGNVVVIGDVNSGAEVISTGNIVILGVLRGIAHAGCSGNKKAFVAAYKLKPAQLRIADLIARSPDGTIQEAGMPEIAVIKQGTILVEPYLPNKYF